MSKIEIEVTAAVDGAVSGLRKVEGQLEKTGDATEVIAKQTQKSTLSFTEFNSAIAIGKQALQMLEQAYRAVIAPTVDYAKEVRDLGRTIGASAEESSKLIQAADDVLVSTSSLEAGLKAAIRKGISPTIEGLGKMADKYTAIQDPIARTKFLMDNFGRSGADLAPLMEKGSAGIAAMGQSAEDAGLVMSGQAVQAARDYEIAVDNVQDSVKGLTYALGNEAIPALTGFLDSLNENIAISRLATQAQDMGTLSTSEWAKMHMQLERGILSTADAQFQLTEKIRTEIVARNQQADALTNWVDEGDRAIAVTAALKGGLEELPPPDAAPKMLSLSAATVTMASALENLATKTDSWNTTVGKNVIDLLSEAKIKGDDYSTALRAIDGATGSTYASQEIFNQKLAASVEQFKKTGDAVAFSDAIQGLAEAYGPAAYAAEAAYDKFYNVGATITDITQPATEELALAIDTMLTPALETATTNAVSLDDALGTKRSLAKTISADTIPAVMQLGEQGIVLNGILGDVKPGMIWTIRELDSQSKLWSGTIKDTLVPALGKLIDSAGAANTGLGQMQDKINKLYSAGFFSGGGVGELNPNPAYVPENSPVVPQRGNATRVPMTLPSSGGRQALGGDYMVNQPTLFLAGEAGPERATFTPQGQMGSATTIHNIVTLDGQVIFENFVREAGARGMQLVPVM